MSGETPGPSPENLEEAGLKLENIQTKEQGSSQPDRETENLRFRGEERLEKTLEESRRFVLQTGKRSEEAFYKVYNEKSVVPQEVGAFDRVIQDYPNEISWTKETLKNLEGVGLAGDRYWLGAVVHDGVPREGPQGRFYLNPKVESMHEVFRLLVEESAKEGLHVSAKMPGMKLNRDGSVSAPDRLDLIRADKIVFYFSPKEEAQSLKVIRNIWYSRSKDFKEVIPRFTTYLDAGDGKVMQGVGFGQQPQEQRGSFGSVRASILARVFEPIGTEEELSKQELMGRFREIASDFSVDPERPEFNLGGRELFPTIAGAAV